MPKHKIDSIPWEPIEDSSNIQATFWHDKTQTICVKFNSGGIYSYIGAPETVYLDLRHAQSVGQYLHRVVKAYPYTRWDTESDLLSHLNV
jgi:hypothetical protein